MQQSSSRAMIVCLAASLFFYYVFFQMAMFNSLNQHLLIAFHIQAAQLGNLSGAYFLADAIALIPVGILLDRMSTKLLMLIFMSLCVLSTFMFAYTHIFGVAVLSHAIAGIGNAVAFLGSMQLAARWLAHKHLAMGMGLIITIGMIAGVVAQTPFTLLIQHVGWRDAVMTNAISGIAILIIMAFALKDRPQQSQRYTRDNEFSIFKQIKIVARKPQNWICGIYTTFMYFPVVILGELWGVMYLTQTRGLATTQATNITGMIFLGMIFGSPILGWCSDKMNRRRIPMTITAIATFAIIIAIIYMPTLSVSNLLVLFFALGFFACGQVLSFPTVAESNRPALTSSALSIVAISLNLGSAIVQPIFGWIMHWHYPSTQHVAHYLAKDYLAAMMLLPIVLAITILLSLKVRETFCQQVAKAKSETNKSQDKIQQAST